jgi:hypothetical protein
MISHRSRTIAFTILACAVVVEFLARGPYRALYGQSGPSQDLAVHYAAARVWLQGGNPYDMSQVGQAFLHGGGPREVMPNSSSMPFVYPSITNVVEVPLALLGWKTATVLAQIFMVSMVVLALFALARRARLDGRRRALFIVLGLALAPLQTGLAEGQVAVPSAALVVLGWSIMDDRPALSGVLVALGAALKPQLAIPIGVVALARPNVRWLAAAGGLFLVMFGIGELRLGGQGIPAWLHAVSASAATGGMNSPTPDNLDSLTLINLDMLLLRLVPESSLAKALSICFVAPLGFFAFRGLRNDPTRRTEIYSVSLLCLAWLLGVYHRVYDAVILWVPIAAFVSDWKDLKGPVRALGALTLAAFLIPGPTVLQVLATSGRIPALVTGSHFWKILVIPYQVWILAMAGLVLLYMIAPRTQAAESPVVASKGAADAERFESCA